MDRFNAFSKAGVLLQIPIPTYARTYAIAFIATSLGLGIFTPTAHGAGTKSESPATATSLGDGIFVLGGSNASKYLEKNYPINRHPMTGQKGKPSSPVTNSSVNDRLVRFCRSNLGRKVGNGQCSELAVLGLPASGGVLDFNNMWGRNICQIEAVNGRPTVRLGSAGTLSRDKKRVEVERWVFREGLSSPYLGDCAGQQGRPDVQGLRAECEQHSVRHRNRTLYARTQCWHDAYIATDSTIKIALIRWLRPRKSDSSAPRPPLKQGANRR
jgi:hypothetical protein